MLIDLVSTKGKSCDPFINLINLLITGITLSKIYSSSTTSFFAQFCAWHHYKLGYVNTCEHVIELVSVSSR